MGKAKAKAKRTSKGKTSNNSKAKPKLTPTQVKVLRCLAKGREMTRLQMAPKVGITKGWSKLLGAVTRDGLGVQDSQHSMIALGLIRASETEGTRVLEYSITAKGKRELAKVK